MIRGSVHRIVLVACFELLACLLDRLAKTGQLGTVGATCSLTNHAERAAEAVSNIAILLHLHNVGCLRAKVLDLSASISTKLAGKIRCTLHQVSDIAALSSIFNLASLLRDTLDKVVVSASQGLEMVCSVIVEEAAKAELIASVDCDSLCFTCQESHQDGHREGFHVYSFEVLYLI